MLGKLRQLFYPGSRVYWERRYAKGGHSGSGSSGRLAAYKAEILNQFVKAHGIQSVLELGCGDGQQLQLADYPSYLGMDIAPSAIALCQKIFAHDPSKTFALYQPEAFRPSDFTKDAAISLEVIFHLTETHLYQKYLSDLFGSARQWVVIFSSDEEDQTMGIFPHFKPRPFTRDIPQGWVLREHLLNPHRDISVSDFYFYEKVDEG